MIITLDGPAGTGKSTIAKKMAERLQFSYVDTGAMYRSVTYAMLLHKISIDNLKAIEEMLTDFPLHIQPSKEGLAYFLKDLDITNAIRTAEVDNFVSQVASLKCVREAMVEIQRNCAKGVNAVFEGRDLGSVVFPTADLKFYLTADLKVCAQRRYQQLLQKNQLPVGTTEQTILENLEMRNQIDSSREISPLVIPERVIKIDTTNLSIEQVLDIILQHCNSRLFGL